MGLCSYILEHIVFGFEFSRCVCIVSMLCLIFNFLCLCLILNFLGLCFILNFLGLCLILNFLNLCLILNFFYLNFEFSGGEKKKPRNFFF